MHKWDCECLQKLCCMWVFTHAPPVPEPFHLLLLSYVSRGRCMLVARRHLLHGLPPTWTSVRLVLQGGRNVCTGLAPVCDGQKGNKANSGNVANVQQHSSNDTHHGFHGIRRRGYVYVWAFCVCVCFLRDGALCLVSTPSHIAASAPVCLYLSLLTPCIRPEE